MTQRKLLDLARVGLAVLVGVAVVLSKSADVLHLSPGVTAVIAAVIALAGQLGIRTQTTPAAAVRHRRRAPR